MRLGDLSKNVDGLIVNLAQFYATKDSFTSSEVKKQEFLPLGYPSYSSINNRQQDRENVRINHSETRYGDKLQLRVLYSLKQQEISVANPDTGQHLTRFIARNTFEEMGKKESDYKQKFEIKHPLKPMPGMESLMCREMPKTIFNEKYVVLDNLDDYNLSSAEVDSAFALWDLSCSIGYSLGAFNHPTDLEFIQNNIKRENVRRIAGRQIGMIPGNSFFYDETIFFATPFYSGEDISTKLNEGIKDLAEAAITFENRFKNLSR